MLSSPNRAPERQGATHRKAQSNQDDTATEDEDSDPQLPERHKSNAPKAPATTRPTTRSQQPSKPVSPELNDSAEPDPETFVRPHPDTCARTRPLPVRDPVKSRATQRDVNRSARDDIPERVRKSITAKNKFPKVVTGGREKPTPGGDKSSTELEEPRDAEGDAAGAKDVEVGGQSKPPSPTKSGSGVSPARSVSFRADGANDENANSLGGEGEQVMSSVESENAPVLSQQVRLLLYIRLIDYTNRMPRRHPNVPICVARPIPWYLCLMDPSLILNLKATRQKALSYLILKSKRKILRF